MRLIFLYKLSKKIILFLLIIQLSSCVSSALERPIRNIDIRFDAFEYISSSERDMTFLAKGRLHNPNEFSIRPLHFTYQMILDGKFFEKGKIPFDGSDSRIGIELGLGKPEFSSVDDKLLYKSNSPFFFEVDIPYSAIGGLARAMTHKNLNYKIDFIFTDERGKIQITSRKGVINLTAILRPLEVSSLTLESINNKTIVGISLSNPNNFDMSMNSCSYKLDSNNIESSGYIFSKPKLLRAKKKLFINLKEKTYFPKGSLYRFQSECNIGKEVFTKVIVGKVR